MKSILFIPIFLCLGAAIAQPVQATLLGAWDDPAVPGSSFYNNRYNEVWGVAVNGREYAVIGSTMGTHFIDVTDPAEPFQRAFVPGKSQGPSIIHRDYKSYQHYVYAVCDEGSTSTLQIMDVSGLPDTLVTVYDSQALLSTAHNIFIDSAQAKLYLFAGWGAGMGGYAGLAQFDLSNPVQPVFVKKYNAIGNFGFGHVHDGFVRNDTAYLNCGNDGFCIADFSNPQQPELLGTLTNYQGAGYNHSGWLSPDGRYYYMADENHGSPVKTVDVQDHSAIEVVDTYHAGSVLTQIPHNQLVACNYLYVSYYYDGLQVYDISNPLDVQRVLFYDTSTEPDGTSYKGAWGVYPFLPSGNILVSDMQNGLFVFQGVGDDCTGGTTAVGEQAAADFRIYPQPASDRIWLEGARLSANARLRLLDAAGRQAAAWSAPAEADVRELPLPAGLAPGLYLLEIQDARFVKRYKLLIM